MRGNVCRIKIVGANGVENFFYTLKHFIGQNMKNCLSFPSLYVLPYSIVGLCYALYRE